MGVWVWVVVLGIVLPPAGLAVSLVALAQAPTAEIYRRAVWRRLARVFGVLSVGSVILVAFVVLFLIGLSHWPAD
jgi:hypothetical protein